jgi:hypothetical protein
MTLSSGYRRCERCPRIRPRCRTSAFGRRVWRGLAGAKILKPLRATALAIASRYRRDGRDHRCGCCVGIGDLPPVVQPELIRHGRLVEVIPEWRFRTLTRLLIQNKGIVRRILFEAAA